MTERRSNNLMERMNEHNKQIFQDHKSWGFTANSDQESIKETPTILRGLSKFYQGKSESFTSLARVMSIEDLPKRMNNYYNNPYNKMKKLKANSKSHGGGLDPKPIITKKFSPNFLRQRSFARSKLVNKTVNNII
ncbi:hypothetical protein R6Q59_021414 [Mikania micrantha]